MNTITVQKKINADQMLFVFFFEKQMHIAHTVGSHKMTHTKLKRLITKYKKM